MAKFLDITGLQTLWNKIKKYVSKYIRDNGTNSTSFHGYPSSGSDSSKFSEFVSKVGTATINLTSGNNTSEASKVFDANSTYTQISKGSKQAVVLYGDYTEIRGKVNFASDNVNFKMSTKSVGDIALDDEDLPPGVKGVEIKKLFNIDNFYSLILIKIYTANIGDTYQLVDVNSNSDTIVTFPPVSSNAGETFGGSSAYTTCVLLPLAKTYAGSHYMNIVVV